ncbi:retron Ec78 anti-phage system effector ATPase PtuA [Plesiomonas shigelloides]|uniref:retron Ec78 anti-phage system effector ATPase PtuA n=1 Tax=Plesiomonas shigelloides TaxID=703 RepID=UPI00387EF97E
MNRNIRKFVLKSEQGSFSASYQLYKIYDEGIGVDANPVLADKYKEVLSSQLHTNNLRINSLKLNGFKGFDSVNIEFPKNSNVMVFVGNNGSGKSSILDAIKKCMTHTISRLATRSQNGEPIESLEINKLKQHSSINMTYDFGGVDFMMEINASQHIDDSRLKSDYQGINELGLLFRSVNSINPNTSFPILAAYTVDRANDVTTKDIERSDEIINIQVWEKLRGYNKSLTGRADFKLFFRWVKELIEIENSDNAEVIALKEEIKSKEADLNNPLLLNILSKSNDDAAVNSLMNDYRKKIEKLKKRLNSYYNINTKTLSVVEKAIYSFLPGFSNLKLQRSPLDLLISKDDLSLSVLQLSQGEKTVLALVGDLARRLTLLNPGLDNPLDGNGIVLIDEIDLHLHPTWQQKILQRLTNVFPNIQFIVTTHSPLVCHTIDAENILLLKDSKIFNAPNGVRGAVSSWVLKNLFFVDERPPEDEYTNALKRYEELVYSNNYSSDECNSLYEKLVKHFGADYSVLVSAQLYIEGEEWERQFDKD